MKLELNVKEVKAILLENVQAAFPGKFDTIEFKMERYGSGIESVLFTKADEAKEGAE